MNTETLHDILAELKELLDYRQEEFEKYEEDSDTDDADDALYLSDLLTAIEDTESVMNEVRREIVRRGERPDMGLGNTRFMNEFEIEVVDLMWNEWDAEELDYFEKLRRARALRERSGKGE